MAEALLGAETLSISVGEAIESLEDFYEPYLIQKGYLKRTPRGRMVTMKAYELLNLPCKRISMKTKDFSFDLPTDLIAQTPADRRGTAGCG
jgi:Holliday junction DNA helicase RuvB